MGWEALPYFFADAPQNGQFFVRRAGTDADGDIQFPVFGIDDIAQQFTIGIIIEQLGTGLPVPVR